MKMPSDLQVGADDSEGGCMVCVMRRVLGKRIFRISSRTAAWWLENCLPLSVASQGDVRCAVHGDDFTCLACDDQLRQIEETLRNHYSLVVRGVLGPESGDLKKISVLGRQLVWTEGGSYLKRILSMPARWSMTSVLLHLRMV